MSKRDVDFVDKWFTEHELGDPGSRAMQKYIHELERNLATASEKLKAFRADSEFLAASVRSLLFKTFPPNTPSQDIIRMARSTLTQHDKLVKGA